MILGNAKHIHFVGIGGIGMSGIAEILVNLGFSVSGSDVQKSPITERLEELGVKVSYRHAKANVKGADVIVVSSAIRSGNSEVVAAREAGIPVIPRSDMLGELMRVRTGIAIAGAHGKTTTTSLAGTVLTEAGLDPTIIVGGKVKNLLTNARLGEGKFLVAEVDESDGNFVRLTPTYAIITNIDLEHLDFYGSLENILEAFVSFSRMIPFHGEIICCIDDPHVRSIIPRIERKVVTYGFSGDADVRAKIVKRSLEGTYFEVIDEGKKIGELVIPLPGSHNVLNALSVYVLARDIGVRFASIKKAMKRFEGVSRRFERKGEAGGILFIDDYGHHPTEIAATLRAARESFKNRIVVLFQPHRYTRTRDLHEQFSRCFREADLLFLTDIYPAGEKAIEGVSGELIYRDVIKSGFKAVRYYPEREQLKKAVLEELKEQDVVITLGAGDIWKLGEEILQEIREREIEG